MTESLEQKLRTVRILPVVTPHSPESTLELARALVAGGIGGIEITLRTAAAIESLIAVKESDIDIQLGVGTVTSDALVHQVSEIGVDFAVSPGVTHRVLDAARETGLQLLPGISSPSELMLGMEYGLEFFKLFPANAINALPLLKSLAGPFPGMKFCPTGGVNPDNVHDYLNMSSVVCVGGSWMVSDDLVRAGNWTKIAELSRQAMALVGASD